MIVVGSGEALARSVREGDIYKNTALASAGVPILRVAASGRDDAAARIRATLSAS